MGKLKEYETFEEKNKLFFNKEQFVQIDTKEEFDQWFKFYTSNIKESKKTDFIYRGMGDARYKLYTSAQRAWIQNDMKEWCGKNFLHFINDMISQSKTYPLINKVFDLYDYNADEREFPILSILQHYTAPTPLMDWSYNLNVALFFATENLQCGNGHNKLSDYFSIYRIDKSKNKNEFLHIVDFSGGSIPSFDKFLDFGDHENKPNANGIFYISDFDEGNSYGTTPNAKIKIVARKPLTTIYNQNIIPQEGVFIFNPFSEKTIEEVFNASKNESGWNLQLRPFSCFNIKKDLADYIRRRIKEKYSIDKNFIYPKLNEDAQKIKNLVLNRYCKK